MTTVLPVMAINVGGQTMSMEGAIMRAASNASMSKYMEVAFVKLLEIVRGYYKNLFGNFCEFVNRNRTKTFQK